MTDQKVIDKKNALFKMFLTIDDKVGNVDVDLRKYRIEGKNQ